MENIGQRIINGDCLEVLKGIAENSVDSIVTDPPYELGFMGKKWDNTGIAYNVELWSECLRVLKPGGHLLAFSGTRTYHRMAVAIEDAGFEVRDMIEWVYGSGFPKSLNIGKAVDKLQGNEREVMPNPKAKQQTSAKDGIYGDYEATTHISKGTSEWEGCGTALKPAHEPICMARKPLSEKNVAENCLKWGTGGIDIDGSRVGTEGARFNGRSVDSDIYGKYGTDKLKEVYNYGRFPANLIHDGSEEVRECFPETKSQGHFNSKVKMVGHTLYEGGFKDFEQEDRKMNDSGNASRFFKSIIYQAKASKVERGEGNFHPTVKPVALMEYLINMVTPPSGTVLDPFGGSGTTAVASIKLKRNFILIEREAEYIEIIKARVNKTNQDSELTLF